MSTYDSAPKALQMNRDNDTKWLSHISASPQSPLRMDPKTTEQSAVLEPATVIYHESAHSIVFRDNLRRAHEKAAIKRRESDRIQAMTSTPTRGRSKNLDSREEENAGKTQSAQSSASSCSSASASRSMSSRTSKPSTTRSVKPETGNTNNSNHSCSKDQESSHAIDDESNLDGDNQSDASSSTSSNDNSHQLFMDSFGLSMPQSQNHSRGEKKKNRNKEKSTEAGEKSDIPTPNIVVANFTPIIDPLPLLDLGPHDEFTELLHSAPFVVDESQQSKGGEKAKPNPEVWETMTEAEKDVVTKIQQETCVVKTIQTSAWNAFLHKFPVKDGEDGEMGGGRWSLKAGENASLSKNRKKYIIFPQEKPPELLPFHSFATATTLLPSCGFKMRCYGSIKEHATGVLFALPTNDNNEESEAAHRSNTWCWPPGYSAKTEYNIDNEGNLINGRADALVSLDDLRRRNYSYLYDKNYEIMGKTVALKAVPFNEIYLRVGGTIGSHDCDRSFDDGVGLPIAIFVRSATYGNLTSLLRIRARLASILGRDHVHGIPLLYITPETGVRVLTEGLQKKLLLVMSNSLNPFQNPQLKHHTSINKPSEKHLEQKVQALLDLDDDGIREILTPEECARVAGGYGATDDSVANLLMEAVLDDVEHDRSTDSSTLDGHTKLRQGKLQELVNEGLTAAVRSGDYNTSRQLLILYTLVATKGQQEKNRAQSITLPKSVGDNTGAQGYLLSDTERIEDALGGKLPTGEHVSEATTKLENESLVPTTAQENSILNSQNVPPPPPPPPLDTDRLRSATNSDGLLAVLGAAQVLKSMQDGNGKLRTLEAVAAIEEWIDKSENSMSFRVASWRQLRAAQGDLKIATEQDSNFMAFISNKAIDTRKNFAKELKNSVSNTKFESIDFLKSIHAILSKMNNPCLRLELLQFILGLDNRYSIAHVIRSVELAATCLNISAYETMRTESEHSLTEYIL